MLPSGPRVFLEIGIGDQKRDNKEQLDWQVTQRFMQSKAQQVPIELCQQPQATAPWQACYSTLTVGAVQLGLPQNAQQCSAEQLELAQDVFTSDPGWAKQVSELA